MDDEITSIFADVSASIVSGSVEIMKGIDDVSDSLAYGGTFQCNGVRTVICAGAESGSIRTHYACVEQHKSVSEWHV